MSNRTDHHEHLGDPPIRGVDLTLATLLLFSLLLGTTGNLVSQYFFWRQTPRSTNSTFFKRIYQTISCVDLLICITLFPVIEAFFKDPEHDPQPPVLFGAPWFCYSWGLLWEVLPAISVFLVAVLSISRLVLLIKPTIQLRPALFGVLVGGYLTLTVVVKCGLIFSHNKMAYWVIARHCIMVYDGPGKDSGELDFDSNQLKTTVVMMVQLALPIFPVAMSFVSTMTALYKTEAAAKRVKSSLKAQHQAGITVVIVTLVYILFNLPVVVHFGLILRCVAEHSRPDTLEKVCHYESIYSSASSYYYMWPFMYVVCVALNSTVNPIVYFLRMKQFRKFVTSRISESFSSRITTVGLSNMSPST